MALDKEKLKQEIIEIQQEMLKKEALDFEFYAQKLADAIEAFVKSGTVTIEKGIALQAGSYTGATTSVGTGKIS